MSDPTSGNDDQRADDTGAERGQQLKLAAEYGTQDAAVGCFRNTRNVDRSNAFAAEIHQWAYEIDSPSHQAGDQCGSKTDTNPVRPHQNMPRGKRPQERHGHFSEDGCRTGKSHTLNLDEGGREVDLCEEDNQYYKSNAECRDEKEAFHGCSNIETGVEWVNGRRQAPNVSQ